MKFIGEIYNKDELGLTGDDASCAEQVFRKWREAGFARLRGAFAFTLQDGDRTYIVRDQFGSVPVYYYLSETGKLFVSDRVLDLLEQGVPRKLSRQGLLSYLSYGCACTPLTLIDGVVAVPQGHYACVRNGKAELHRYWMPDFTPGKWTQDSAQEAVTAAFRESVDRQMHYNGGAVPAAFLSGGIDSSSIVAMMRKQYDGEIRTYCVKHDDDKTEESGWARKVADCNHTKHTELHLSDTMLKTQMLDAVSSYDQPTVDGVNFWFATKLVKEAGESMIFSGEGGDELFAGYWRFAKHQMAYKWSARFRCLGSGIWGGLVGRALEALAPNEKVRKLGELLHERTDPYTLPRRIYSDAQVQAFLKPELKTQPNAFMKLYLEEDIPGKSDLVNRISWLEMQTITPDMWLRDGYQDACANGLGMRTPILDVKLAELLYTMPGALKCTPEYLKPLLVRAAGEGMPLACATRRKMGFGLPFQRYFTGELKGLIDEFLKGENLALFDAASVRALGRLYRAGRVNWSRVWILFVIEFWCKLHRIGI